MGHGGRLRWMARDPRMISSRPTAGDESALREPRTQDVAADSQQMRGLHLVFVAEPIGFGHDGCIDAFVELGAALLEHLHQHPLKCQERGLVRTRSFNVVRLAPWGYRQVRYFNTPVSASQYGPVDDVFELANIAWPRMVEQLLHGFTAEGDLVET